MWEMWTGREPYENWQYHALMHALATEGARVRPPVPGSPDWDLSGPVPPEPAPGVSPSHCQHQALPGTHPKSNK